MVKRTLILIRHAKARKRRGSVLARIDLARPLIGRGRQDARTMGKRLAKGGLHPDLIWTSPAKRALDTALIIAKQLDYRRKNIRIDPRLYATSASALAQRVRALNRRLSSVVLCGHNPELQALAQRWGSELQKLPTCGVVELQFEASLWSDVGRSMLLRSSLDYPRRR